MAQVNFRMDDGLKSQAEEEFRRMGLTFSAAIGLMCTQVVLKHRLPFSIETVNSVSGSHADVLSEADRTSSGGSSALVRRFRDFAEANTIVVPADFRWNRVDAAERQMGCLA